MPYAFLIVTLVGAVAVALAYRPIRREPFTVLSFTCGWIAGELAFQNIVWQMVATALFIWFGALVELGRLARAWPSPSSTGSGSSGWASPGAGPPRVTAAALDEVRSGAVPGARPSRPRRRGAAGGG